MSQSAPDSTQSTTVATPGSLAQHTPSATQHSPRQDPDTYQLGPVAEGGQAGRQDHDGPGGGGEEGVDRQGQGTGRRVTLCLLLRGTTALSVSEQKEAVRVLLVWYAAMGFVWLGWKVVMGVVGLLD